MGPSDATLCLVPSSAGCGGLGGHCQTGGQALSPILQLNGASPSSSLYDLPPMPIYTPPPPTPAPQPLQPVAPTSPTPVVMPPPGPATRVPVRGESVVCTSSWITHTASLTSNLERR